MLVTLQSFVQVTGTDTTETATPTVPVTVTETTMHTTQTSASQQTDSAKQKHLDSNVINSDSKQTDEDVSTMDHDTQIKVEKNLLTLFGMSKRPKPIDRSKVVIPDAMKMLYAEIMGEELRESVNLPKPGMHTKSANTVRSFTHEGMYQIKSHRIEQIVRFLLFAFKTHLIHITTLLHALQTEKEMLISKVQFHMQSMCLNNVFYSIGR